MIKKKKIKSNHKACRIYYYIRHTPKLNVALQLFVHHGCWLNQWKKALPYLPGKNSVHGTVCHDELYYDLKEAQYQNVSDGRQFYRPALPLLSLN